jgi:hypothetical protein
MHNRSAQRRAVRRAEAACEEQQNEWDVELYEQQQLQQAEEAELLHNVRYTFYSYTLYIHDTAPFCWSSKLTQVSV